MSYTIHHGDALAMLRGLSSESVDSIVTDPPVGRSAREDEEDFPRGSLCAPVVRDPNDSVADLPKRPISPGVACPVLLSSVVWTIQLDDQMIASTRKVEVNAEAPMIGFDDVLVLDDDVEGEKSAQQGELVFGDREALTGRIGAGPIDAEPSSGPSRVRVGLLHYAFGQTKGSPGVVAFGRAELSSVLSSNSAFRTGKPTSTESAVECFGGTEPFTPQFVGAIAVACCLTTMPQASRIGRVSSIADRTVAVHLLAHLPLLSSSYLSLKPDHLEGVG